MKRPPRARVLPRVRASTHTHAQSRRHVRTLTRAHASRAGTHAWARACGNSDLAAAGSLVLGAQQQVHRPRSVGCSDAKQHTQCESVLGRHGAVLSAVIPQPRRRSGARLRITWVFCGFSARPYGTERVVVGRTAGACVDPRRLHRSNTQACDEQRLRRADDAELQTRTSHACMHQPCTHACMHACMRADSRTHHAEGTIKASSMRRHTATATALGTGA